MSTKDAPLVLFQQAGELKQGVAFASQQPQFTLHPRHVETRGQVYEYGFHHAPDALLRWPQPRQAFLAEYIRPSD
jgi:hypothetical protein